MDLRRTVRQSYLIVTAAAAWLGLSAQLYLGVTHYNPTHSLSYRVGFTMSYFTVLTNLLVAMVVTAAIIGGGSFLTRPGTRAATLVYIFVVGLIYALFLKGLWQPTGLQFAADVALHSVTPVMYVLYWLVLVPKGALGWRQPAYWLLCPLLYMNYLVAFGVTTGSYLYPFVDLDTLDTVSVLFNGAVFLFGFYTLGLIVVMIDKFRGAAGTRRA